MRTNFRRPSLWLALFVSIFCIAGPAHAEYPADKPIQVISPFAAGGANDFLTRMTAKELAEELKVNAIAENKAGANGIVGASYVAKAAPDGYTLLMGNSGVNGTNVTLYPNTPYNAEKDFAAVSMVGAVPIVLVINSDLGINSVKELLAYGKTHPGKLSFSSSGIGGTGHLAGETFKAATHLDVVHVPYKGDGPAVTDAMGGQVSMAFVGVASAAPQLASGKIKVLAVAHAQRLASLPNVPTMAEAGVKDVVFSQWYALVTRAGTPDDRIQKLNAAMKVILAKSAVQKNLATLGAVPIYMTPADSKAFMTSEVIRFGKIIRALNIKPQS